MEAMVGRQYWDHWDKFGMRQSCRRCVPRPGSRWSCKTIFSSRRSCQGPSCVSSPKRKWRSTDGRSRARRGTAADADVPSGNPYRRRSRRRNCGRGRLRRLAEDEQCAQAIPEGRTRRNPRWRQGSRTGSKLSCADRSDGQGRPFRPGRLPDEIGRAIARWMKTLS